jgi:hypothetical protein
MALHLFYLLLPHLLFYHFLYYLHFKLFDFILTNFILYPSFYFLYLFQLVQEAAFICQYVFLSGSFAIQEFV